MVICIMDSSRNAQSACCAQVFMSSLLYKLDMKKPTFVGRLGSI